MLRAPSIRLFSGEWVGNLNSQSVLFIGSGAYFSGVEGPASLSDDFPHELRIHPARKPRRNRFLRTKAVRPGQSSQGNQAHFVKSPHIYFHLSRMVFIP